MHTPRSSSPSRRARPRFSCAGAAPLIERPAAAVEKAVKVA
ncbi:hypothetical protein [Streptomyces sp. H39-S7]|nr:hypothetical protein [Streptomyces sp. H39-S7]MCZ4124405.1 hypothetical protein [Streptomyces sp. H39-S7]